MNIHHQVYVDTPNLKPRKRTRTMYRKKFARVVRTLERREKTSFTLIANAQCLLKSSAHYIG